MRPGCVAIDTSVQIVCKSGQERERGREHREACAHVKKSIGHLKTRVSTNVNEYGLDDWQVDLPRRSCTIPFSIPPLLYGRSDLAVTVVEFQPPNKSLQNTDSQFLHVIFTFPHELVHACIIFFVSFVQLLKPPLTNCQTRMHRPCYSWSRLHLPTHCCRPRDPDHRD